MSDQPRRGRPPYPPEGRERAVRMVFEHQHEDPSQWKAIESIAEKLSINDETLRIWVRRQAIHEPTRSTTYRTLRTSARPDQHLHTSRRFSLPSLQRVLTSSQTGLRRDASSPASGRRAP